MLTRHFCFVVPLAGLVAMSTHAIADTVAISGGGQVAGKVLSRDDTGVILRVDEGIRVKIPKSRVAKVVKSAELVEYARLAKAAGLDPAKHYQLARWCLDRSQDPSRSLRIQSRYHMQRVIALDPDHKQARAALGYVTDRGGWISYEQQQRNRGKVLHNRRWLLPEAVAAERANDEANVKASKWVKEVARLRTSYLKTGNVEALNAMKAIDDPLASMAIAGELEKSRGNANFPGPLRELWVDQLGQFRNGVTVRALVLASVDEPNARVREKAIDYLKEYGSSSAIATYLGMLKPGSSRDSVRRGLISLKSFPNPELYRSYINALVTEHKTVGPARAGTEAGFSNTGGNSFSTGSKPTVRIDHVRNQSARDLLGMIAPGVDHGFDKTAWLQYFSRQLTSYEGNLRRDS